MVEITVERLEAAKRTIESGLNCDCILLAGGFTVTSDAIEWLKTNHYQLKVIETFGQTGIAIAIYPA